MWNKTVDRVFQTTPGSIAVEADFYRLHEVRKAWPRSLHHAKKQLSEMEGGCHHHQAMGRAWSRAMPGRMGRLDVEALQDDQKSILVRTEWS